MSRATRPLAALIVFALAAGCDARAASATAAAPLRLSIAFTGDVSGYLEPCG